MFGSKKEAESVRQSRELAIRGVAGPALGPGGPAAPEGPGRWHNSPVFGPLAPETPFKPKNSFEQAFTPHPVTAILGGTPLTRGIALVQRVEGLISSEAPVGMYAMDLTGAGGPAGEVSLLVEAADQRGYQVRRIDFSPAGIMAGFGNQIDKAADLIVEAMPSRAGGNPEAERAERVDRSSVLTEVAEKLRIPYLDIAATHDALSGLILGGDNFGNLTPTQINGLKFELYDSEARLADDRNTLRELRNYLGKLRKSDPALRPGGVFFRLTHLI